MKAKVSLKNVRFYLQLFLLYRLLLLHVATIIN